jgi:hypothetical protein
MAAIVAGLLEATRSNSGILMPSESLKKFAALGSGNSKGWPHTGWVEAAGALNLGELG